MSRERDGDKATVMGSVIGNNEEPLMGRAQAYGASIQDSEESQIIIESAPWKTRACCVKLMNPMHIKNILELFTDRGFEVDYAALVGDECVIVGFTSKQALDEFVRGDWKTIQHIIVEVKPLINSFLLKVLSILI